MRQSLTGSEVGTMHRVLAQYVHIKHTRSTIPLHLHSFSANDCCIPRLHCSMESQARQASAQYQPHCSGNASIAPRVLLHFKNLTPPSGRRRGIQGRTNKIYISGSVLWINDGCAHAARGITSRSTGVFTRSVKKI